MKYSPVDAFLILVVCLVAACSTHKSPAYYEAGTSVNNTHGPSGTLYRTGDSCFVNCLRPDQYNIERSAYPFYTGSAADAPIVEKNIQVKPGSTKWQRAQVNGFDVMKLTEIPPEWTTIRYLADTVKYRAFEYRYIKIKSLLKAGGFTEKTAVVCPEAVSLFLVQQVSAALTKEGYSHTTDGTITPSFTEALKQYQKDNGLAIGQISYETLEVLAIRKI